VLYRHGPFLPSFIDCQANALDRRPFTGKALANPDHLSTKTVAAFDGAGGPDRFSQLRWINAHRSEVVPVACQLFEIIEYLSEIKGAGLAFAESI